MANQETRLMEKYIEAVMILSHLQTDDNELRDDCLLHILKYNNWLLEGIMKEENKEDEVNGL